jgi:hypothetical protein
VVGQALPDAFSSVAQGGRLVRLERDEHIEIVVIADQLLISYNT